MLLTATCTYTDAQDIHTSLEISPENFSIIRGSSFECKEIVIEAYKRKDNRQNFLNNIIDLIKKHETGKIIIYCAIRSGCNDHFAMLQPLLPDNDLDVYHGGLDNEQRESTISR